MRLSVQDTADRCRMEGMGTGLRGLLWDREDGYGMEWAIMGWRTSL